MALLKVVRDSGYAADFLRAYKIVLDGKTISKIRNGVTELVSISPGQHELRLRIDWCESNRVQFTAAEGELVVFKVTPGLRGIRNYFALWYMLFAPKSYLQLDRVGQ